MAALRQPFLISPARFLVQISCNKNPVLLVTGSSACTTWHGQGFIIKGIGLTAHAHAQLEEERPKRNSALRDERLQQLMDSCQEEILKQIIGPFGLTPAMFDDKTGGNVTTDLNARKGIFAKASEELGRSDYNYQAAKTEIKRDAVKSEQMNSQVFVDAYSGQEAPTKRTTSSGKVVMNAELDHLVSVKEIHADGGWMRDKQGRKTLSSVKENLHYTTHETNRAKGCKTPEEALSAEVGFDQERIAPMVQKAREAIEEKLPTTGERVRYHGEELLFRGAAEATKNALRQSLGILLHEFVSGSFHEIRILLKDRDSEKSLVDRLYESLKRVMQNVAGKLRAAMGALVDGGIQGFISNLLTFLINNLITTSKKIVTLIRESMRGVWQAIKLVLSPPEGMPAIEVAREAMKIIAAVVTTGLGMLLEESMKGFILSFPVLAPIADSLALGVTSIMTGIAGAMVVYSIDRLFDWLSASDTELLQAQEDNAQAQATIVARLQQAISLQFDTSRMYEVAANDYQQLRAVYSQASFQIEVATIDAKAAVASRNVVALTFEEKIALQRRVIDELDSL
jgi:hypothetical protein